MGDPAGRQRGLCRQHGRRAGGLSEATSKSEYDLIIAEQQARAEAAARHIAQGVEREREAERLRSEQAARADAHAAEMRRLAAGELPV